MKLRTKKHIYIRSKEPWRRMDNKKGVLFPGFEVNVIKKVAGEEIQSNADWYVDENGDFLWSGGFAELADTAVPAPVSFYNYNTDLVLDIPQTWTITKGKNIKIGIIDWGFDLTHPSLLHLVKPGRNFNFNNPNTDGNDELDATVTSHGSQCISLLSAMPTMTAGVSGLATDADIYFFQIAKNNVDHFKKAMAMAGTLGLHIVYSSADLSGRYDFEEVKATLSRKDEDGSCLFVGSSRNVRFVDMLDFPKKPFFDPYCLCVGGVRSDAEIFSHNFETLAYCYYSPDKIKVIKQDGVVDDLFSSSYASALFAGTLALYLSSVKENGENEMQITPENVLKIFAEKWTDFFEVSENMNTIPEFTIKPSITKLPDNLLS